MYTLPRFFPPSIPPPIAAAVPNGVNAFTRPSMAFTPVVPRSTKNFTKSESTTVEDNCSTAELNCETLPEILSKYLLFSSEAEPTLSIACAVAFSAS